MKCVKSIYYPCGWYGVSRFPNRATFVPVGATVRTKEREDGSYVFYDGIGRPHYVSVDFIRRHFKKV